MSMTLPGGPKWFYDDYQRGSKQLADLEDGYLRRIDEWRDNNYNEALREHNQNPETNQVPRYIKYLQADHWNGTNWPGYRNRFVNNLMDRARTDSISLLTSGKPSIEIQSNVKTYDQQANIANGLIHCEWLRQAYDLTLASWIDITQLWGTGFIKVVSSVPGVTKIHAYGPDMVFPIRPGRHIQESAAVMFRSFKGPEYFIRKFPLLSENLEREFYAPEQRTVNAFAKPMTVTQATWDQMSPQMRRVVGIRNGLDTMPNQNLTPVIELQEFTVEDESVNQSTRPILMKDPWLPITQHNWWYIVKPGQRLYPRKRLLVFAGRRLMYDGPAPDFHGLFPYASLSLDPVPWSFWGKSYYRNLLPLNEQINKIGGGIMDVVQRALAPTVVSRQNSVSKAAWDKFFPDKPGQKLLLQGAGSPANDVKYMDQPQIPDYVRQYLGEYLMPEFDKHAGSIDMTQIAGKKQAPGGDTIEQMRDTMQSSFQLKGRYIERALGDAGILMMSNCFQYYTKEQRLKMLGEDGITLQDFDYDPTSMIPSALTRDQKMDYWKNFAMTVLPGSMHSGAGDRKKLMDIQLYGMGAISRPELLRTLERGNATQIQQEILEDQKQMILAQGEAQLAVQQGAQMGMLEQQLGSALPPIGNARPEAGGGGPGGTPRLSRGQRNGEAV